MPGSSNLPVILQGSTGGNGAADAGKAATFNAEGQLAASADNSVTAALRVTTTGIAVAAELVSNTGTALDIVSTSGIGIAAFTGDNTSADFDNDSVTAPTLEVTNGDTTNVGPIAHFHDDAGVVLSIENDGGLAWTSTAGRTSANNGLGWQEKYPSADVPVTGTTAVPVTGMSFSALTTKRYHITIVLRGASPAAGTKIGLYTSAGTGTTMFLNGLQNATFFTLNTSAGLDVQGNTFWAGTAANNTFRIDGSFVCGNADCTVDLRVSSNTAGQTTTIEEDGTYMRVFQAN